MEKITLNYSASGQKLKPLYSLKKFASDTVNYVVAVFDLDESWAFDSVRSVWKTENVCISTVLDQDGACTVPQEVLQKKAKVEVNLVGSDVENDQLVERLTTYPVQAFIVDIDVPICGSETAEITPSQFEQFVQIVTTEVAKIRDVDRVELNDDYTITFYYSDGTESPKIGPIRGETGADGNGIQSITKIGSEGRTDTYRITYTNGGHFDFDVTNGEKGDRGKQGETGNGIDRIDKTATAGSVDTYTIYFTDGTTTTFDVTNGEVTKAELETLLPTETASGAIVSFPDGQSVFPMKSLKVNLEPIQDLHGYDSPWVGGSGSNKWDEQWELGGINATTGEGDSSTDRFRSKNFVPCIEGESYYFVCPTANWRMFFYDANQNFVSYIGTYNSPRAVTIPSGVAYIKFWIIGTTYGNNIAINYPSTVTTYSPYSNLCPIYGHDSVGAVVSPTQDAEDGTTYTTDLPQTVYGGTLDVVSGELVVDRAMVTYDGSADENWRSERSRNWQGVNFYTPLPTGMTRSTNGVLLNITDKVSVSYIQDGLFISASHLNFLIGQALGITDVAVFRTWLSNNPIQLSYPLATPQEIQLTPQEIRTLVGQNNVWSEQGDVDVTYKADIQLYIDKKTNELAVAIAAL